MTQHADKPSTIGRNFLLGNRKKIAKFLMRTFTCRSTFLYGRRYVTVSHPLKCHQTGVLPNGIVCEPAWCSPAGEFHALRGIKIPIGSGLQPPQAADGSCCDGCPHGLENIYWIGHRGEGPSHAGQRRTVCILS